MIVMNSLIDSFIEYNRKQYSFTEYELAKLKYSVQSILSEISKFLIMVVFFAAIDRLFAFLICTVVLLCIRSYAGGLHFETYRSCLIFTFSFFIAIIGLGGYVLLSPSFIMVAMAISLVLNIALSPIVSKNRPTYAKAKLLQCKIISSAVIVLVMVYLCLRQDGLYNNYIVWTVMLQCLQLLFAFGFRAMGKRDLSL